ncbi:uncharacterized protein I303_107156 [Kwoniella dejecticola CBS 10117]|uniref:Uncharacterized protein n=1 Tax=Kwoniella dejecticola CBS 10117 TaxID=1296121 RepID=A0A1A5ZYW9_9TREE|nr:uncharacterized protein I303_06557 [Kwoniella dejecticola CBS 10117]OBR82999.1 hypothetical protein I303_06557 [Kwoniella dejecticola CBS 10117]
MTPREPSPKREREDRFDSDGETQYGSDEENNLPSSTRKTSTKPRNKGADKGQTRPYRSKFREDVFPANDEIPLTPSPPPVQARDESKSRSTSERAKLIKRRNHEKFEKEYKAYKEQQEKARWSNRYKHIRGFFSFWRRVADWWVVRWAIAQIPYILAIVTVIAGGLVGLSGPFLDIWVVDYKQTKYGAWGACSDRQAECAIKLFYDGPEVGQWSDKALPAILLSFLVDPESGRNNGSVGKRMKKERSIKWFERTMDLSSIMYLMLSLILAGWVSESNADGLSGYDLAIFLAISPFIWIFCRLFYRSKWVSRRFHNAKEVIEHGSRSRGPKSTHERYHDTDADSDDEEADEREGEYDDDEDEHTPRRQLHRIRAD